MPVSRKCQDSSSIKIFAAISFNSLMALHGNTIRERMTVVTDRRLLLGLKGKVQTDFLAKYILLRCPRK
jgi:hypothetical protein